MTRMKFNISNWTVVLLLFLAGMIFFSQGLAIHGVEYRDDEVFYYRSTGEMLANHNFLSPTYFGENRFQKPILYYWFVLASYKIFGLNWFAARFVAVFFAAGSVCLTWLIARKLFNWNVAALSSLMLMTVPLFFRHAKIAVPDMPLNFFIVFSIYAAIQFVNQPKCRKFRILFFVVIAIGFMIKGFVALIIPIATFLVFVIAEKRKDLIRTINFPLGTLVMIIIIAPWFIYMALTHGEPYINYMLSVEVQNRVIEYSDENVFIKFFRSTGRNILFYLEALMSYFAPWVLLIFAAIPLAFRRIKERGKMRNSWLWMLVWFLSVWIFFCCIHVTLSHYLLILSTPFVILISAFLLDSRVVALRSLTKYYFIFLLFVSILAVAFLQIFLMGSPKSVLVLLMVVFIGLAVMVNSSRNPLVPPLSMSLVLILILSQTHVMANAGITAHATLQKMARTIKQEQDPEFIIGVGSHDIHEKELQIYFDKPIQKAGASNYPETRMNLANLLSRNEKVFCLMTQKDYDDHFDYFANYPHKIIQEEFIIRKRFNLDRGFVAAVIKLDFDQVHDYLMEKIILVKKKTNV